MPFYLYKARDTDGTLISGEIEAGSEKEAKILLAQKSLMPVSAELKSAAIKLPSLSKKSAKSKTKDLIAFTRQFAALFKAGVPMDRALSALSRQTKNYALQECIKEIKKDVSQGSSLMVAFSKHPIFFNELYINMLNIGEQGGILEKTLATLVDILKREHRILSSIKSATLYPKIVLVTFVIVVTLLMMFVMPGFADFYAGYNAELPLPTRIMIATSNLFVDYWYLLFGFLGLLIVLFKKYTQTEKGSFQYDKLMLKLPVFGNLNLMVANARFAHLMSELYKSGLPLSKALTIVGNTIGNKLYKRDISTVKEGLEKGAALSDAMKNGSYFTPMIIESVNTGEQTGVLDEVLTATAEFYDEEVTDILEQLTTLIEPILLFGLFGLIALLAFAVFLPIWNVTKLVLPGG